MKIMQFKTSEGVDVFAINPLSVQGFSIHEEASPSFREGDGCIVSMTFRGNRKLAAHWYGDDVAAMRAFYERILRVWQNGGVVVFPKGSSTLHHDKNIGWWSAPHERGNHDTA